MLKMASIAACEGGEECCIKPQTPQCFFSNGTGTLRPSDSIDWCGQPGKSFHFVPMHAGQVIVRFISNNVAIRQYVIGTELAALV